tara:strand:- start:241 stop:531 length:291 start_codon:yes stop_codon:yes gene_type:complete
MYFGVTTIFVCLLSFVSRDVCEFHSSREQRRKNFESVSLSYVVIILVLRARRLPTFGRARREVLFCDFCLEASCASSFVVVVVVRCLRVKKVSEAV